jgi:tRNA(Ile)-lysidine synthase
MGRSASSDPLTPLAAALATASPPFIVGFSGGADSSALLLACAQLAPDVRALHVNHGLHPDADRWEAHCRVVALRAAVTFDAVRVAVEPRGQGIEAAARAARYRAFEAAIGTGTLLLAHHRDDQAETLLLRLLRGASLDGVAAMRERRPIAGGVLLRPWLSTPRAAIAEWLRRVAPDLPCIDDPANVDSSFDRSIVRHQWLPLIEARFPSARERLARFAAHARDSQALLDREAAVALAAVRRLDPSILDLDAWQALMPALRRLVLRRFAVEQCGELPGFHTLQRIENEVIGARLDAEPILAFAGSEFRRYRRSLYLRPRAAYRPLRSVLHWPAGSSRLCLGEHGSLIAIDRDGAETAVPVGLDLRPRCGGERLRYRGMHRELRDLFQQSATPPWERERTPLLYAGDELVAAVGVAHGERLSDLWPGLRVGWLSINDASP